MLFFVKCKSNATLLIFDFFSCFLCTYMRSNRTIFKGIRTPLFSIHTALSVSQVSPWWLVLNFWTQRPHRDGVTSNDGFQSLSMPVTITGIVETDLYPLAIVHILFHDWKKRTFEMSRGRIRTPDRDRKSFRLWSE